MTTTNALPKRWQRWLLDLRVAIPGPIKNAVTYPRRWNIRHVALICSILAVLAIFWTSGHSHDSDILHLDLLMQRFDDSGLHEARNAAGLQSILKLDSTHGKLKKKDVSSEDEDDEDEDEDEDLEEPDEGDIADVDDKPNGGKHDQSNNDNDLDEYDHNKDQYGRDIPDYREIFSVSTRDRKYFLIWWDGEKAYNANLIPHPTMADRWIVMAQKEQSDDPDMRVSSQVVCSAGFINGVLICDAHPTDLSIAPSVMGNCTGDLSYANMRTGPRDGRMFYGPQEPWIMYGSQSSFGGCFGLWLQDGRMLLEPFRLEQHRVGLFRDAMELGKPEPRHVVEKNFFLFWDANNIAYVHHELWPNRVFAQLDFNGGSGADLAPITAGNDARCMASFMPLVRNGQESIHQATNSLSITMCKRSDPRCIPTDDNTYIMHIFHWKSYYEFHGGYEPYVVLFKRNAPFSLYAISQRPFWIHGRAALTEASGSARYRHMPNEIPPGHTEFFYITSMSWKRHGSKYHGYIDDVMFLAFGVEDARAGAIDVTAGDLLQDLAFCEYALPN